MYRKKIRKNGKFLSFLLLFLSVVMFSRLFDLYFSSSTEWLSYKDPVVPGDYYRGSILDRNGNILAFDVPSYDILISDPASLDDALLSHILTAYSDERTLEDVSSMSGSLSIPTTMDGSAARDFGNMIKENSIDSISVTRSKKRLYPVAEHQRNYLEGIEEKYNDVLLPPLLYKEGEVAGKDITLSLDQDLFIETDAVVSKFQDPMIVVLTGRSDGGIRAFSSNVEIPSNYAELYSFATGGDEPYELKNEEVINDPGSESYTKSAIIGDWVVYVRYFPSYELVVASSDRDSARRALSLLVSLPDLAL